METSIGVVDGFQRDGVPTGKRTETQQSERRADEASEEECGRLNYVNSAWDAI